MKTTLLIMAAGIGSRFGTGIKQLEPVDDAGHIIMDYSIHAMNELGLPTPGLYSKRKNTIVGGNAIIAPESEILWNPGIVWRVLRRYEYTGALVMGRRKKLYVNTTAFRTLPEDKWIITENTHEAIVTKDEYYQAQKAIRNVAPIQYKTCLLYTSPSPRD